MKTLWAGFLGLGLLVASCGSDPAAMREADAGGDALVAADSQPPGSGGATSDTGATGGAGGQALADAGGTGGAAVVGTGGVTGSGGTMAGSGGAAGTGGAPATTYRTCMAVLVNWAPAGGQYCLNAHGDTLFKNGGNLQCMTCQPSPFALQAEECTIPNSVLCVHSCDECAPL